MTAVRRPNLQRELVLPDAERLARLRLNPAFGPEILFFSGGSALKDLSEKIVAYTWNSIHLITPFDSGGSSATLRAVFGMPAVGDIRNRLMALADKSIRGNPEIYALFAYRLSVTASPPQLAGELEDLVSGRHRLVARIPGSMRRIILHHLKLFAELRPSSFDLAGASIGNLILTAGYIENQRRLDPIICIYSKLAEVRGTVSPVSGRDCHLAAELADGRLIIGQHRLTRRDGGRASDRIARLFLVSDLNDASDVTATVKSSQELVNLISQASLICYPMGSFFTSLLAALQPAGIGPAISASKAPKIYIPNTGSDNETCGYDLNDQVEMLLATLRKDDQALEDDDLLNYVLLDQKWNYQGDYDPEVWRRRGIETVYYPLMNPLSAPLLDADSLLEVLMTLA